MKFWKTTLLTTVLFFAFSIIVLYTACEKNPCNNVTCFNGGSCGNGICHCPTGYENTQCEDKEVTRYLGKFGGFITCNNLDQVIDSVFIYADTSKPSMINYVWVVWQSIKPKVLHGYVYNNASTYSIIVPDDVDVANSYLKKYTITLQNWGGSENNKLSVQSYERVVTPGDTVNTQCSFLGYKPHK